MRVRSGPQCLSFPLFPFPSAFFFFSFHLPKTTEHNKKWVSREDSSEEETADCCSGRRRQTSAGRHDADHRDSAATATAGCAAASAPLRTHTVSFSIVSLLLLQALTSTSRSCGRRSRAMCSSSCCASAAGSTASWPPSTARRARPARTRLAASATRPSRSADGTDGRHDAD